MSLFRSARRAPSAPDQVDERLERVTALVYALLHDVAAWLCDLQEPVNVELYPEYRLRGVADLAPPRERMARYASPALLASWGEVLDRWVASDYRYRPSYGRNLRVAVTEGGGEGPKAEVTFQDRSEIELPDGGREAPGRRWQLTAWIADDLRQVRTVVIREVPAGR
jgi:hypothetical protein